MAKKAMPTANESAAKPVTEGESRPAADASGATDAIATPENLSAVDKLDDSVNHAMWSSHSETRDRLR
jgi:hypothetical protein